MDRINLLFSLVFVSSCIYIFSDARQFSFSPKDAPKRPCILLDIDYNITMKMSVDGKEVATVVRTDDDDGITVTGSCGERQGTLILHLSNGTTWSFIFKRTALSNVTLDRLVQFIPKQTFGRPADNFTGFYTFDNPGIQTLSDDQSSYSCDAVIQEKYRSTKAMPVNVIFSVVSLEFNIHAQGFNIIDGQFGPSVSCSEDLTTVAPNTTITTPNTTITTPNTTVTTPNVTMTTPITTTPEVPVNEFIVKDDNKTCIVFMGAMTIFIDYKANDTSAIETKTAAIEVPVNAKASGTCNSNSQTLDISFNNGWSLDFNFKSTGDGFYLASQADLSYQLSEINITYVLNEDNFPGTTEPGNVMTVSESRTFLSKSANTGYYQCKSTEDFVLNGGHKIETRFLQFKAFNADDDTSFVGEPSRCNTDDDSDETVAIVVGCVLGGLALIGLITFCVCKYKKKSDYHNFQ